MPEINITPKSSPSPETTIMYEDTTTSFNSYDSAAEISVTIADEKVPIVVFFGAPQCGKTMALVRLARYLKKQNYTVAPVRSFRPSSDEKYKQICDEFDSKIDSSNAQGRTELVDFLLLEVRKRGKKICQILEAPGEGYFDPDDPQKQMDSYVTEIINSQNRKIWVIITEPDWKEAGLRVGYVERIKQLNNITKSNDRFLFLYNKIDKTQLQLSGGKVNENAAIKDVKNLYPGIFEPFKESRPILEWFGGYSCDFATFTTGTYYRHDRGLRYVQSPDYYPERLWSKISKRL